LTQNKWKLFSFNKHNSLFPIRNRLAFPLIITTNVENFCTSFQSEISFHCFNENINHRPFWKDANCFNISRSNSASLSFLSSFYSFCSGVCFSLPLPGKLPCPNSSYSLRHLYNWELLLLVRYVMSFITQLNSFS
jgi:hypothetical protein